ncbi:hypothetical protein ACMDCR_16320 [Labrys okinawensis]|uniref:hypothetical protein n=1 Tax=Labrys okinawensis TaxID=346911 RepID=UPI0039BD9324
MFDPIFSAACGKAFEAMREPIDFRRPQAEGTAIFRLARSVNERHWQKGMAKDGP